MGKFSGLFNHCVSVCASLILLGVTVGTNDQILDIMGQFLAMA